MAGGKSPIHGRSHWLGGADPIAGLKIEEIEVDLGGGTGTPTFAGDECATDFTVGNPMPIFVPAMTAGQVAVVLAGVNEHRTISITDTGWTELGTCQNLGSSFFELLTFGMWWHRALVDEPSASIGLNNPGGGSSLAGSSALWLLNGGSIGEFAMAIHTGTSDLADCPSVTAETDAATLLCGFVASEQRENAGGGSYGWTTPSGMTADCQILQGLSTGGFPAGTYNGDFPPLLSCHEELTATGATGVRQSSHDTGLGGTNFPLLFSLLVEDAA